MKDYSLGKIYKIIDNTTPMFYVGSTTYPKLSQRLAKHRSHLRQYEKGYGKYISAFEILNNGDYKIILLEDYPCENIDQLTSREQYWMDKLICDDMVNKSNAKGLNIEKLKQRNKEYKEAHKEEIAKKGKEYRDSRKEELAQKQKEYRETHKEKEKVRHQKYRENNREQLAQKNKEYRETHKEQIAQKNKQYREKHKEQIAQKNKEKIQCDRCNSIVCKYGFKKHRQTKTCINALPHGLINELAE